MKELHEHEQNAANKMLEVKAVDEPGPGGAHHEYHVRWDDKLCVFPFQNGPIQEVGVNGITNEVLLAVILDRLRDFQGDEFTKNKFACRENAMAITKLEEGLMWLHKRTREREARGVEGTWKQ